MTTTDRNQKVSDLVNKLFKLAEKSKYKNLDPHIMETLEEVFSSTAWGFREILLVITIARLLDPKYRASKAFYKCNPRALYEGPIRTVLLERGIPHKKSGPLNVAKAAPGINKQWSMQRRPAVVATGVVELVNNIESMSREDLENFAVLLHARFLKEAIRVASLSVEAKPESDPRYLYDISMNLIKNVPDAGNTPQRIVGLLLQAYHEDLQSGIKVVGYEDRASVTSTTSKKPGDITEEQLDGTIIKVYEVTVKPFNKSRVVESYETVRDYDRIAGNKTEEVTVICREEDMHPDIKVESPSDIYLGKIEYQDLSYHFVEIFKWIMSQLLRMTPDMRISFYLKLHGYITEPNTAENIKTFWKELHGKGH